MKKPVVKNIKQKLKMAVAGLLVSLTIVTGITIYANKKYDDYLTDQEIEEIAETLDCDTGYINKFAGSYLRMEHNKDEPIYVCFDDELTEEEKQSAIKSLDNIFGIVGTINNNYSYKIVDKSEYNSKIGKTKIYYKLGTHTTSYQGKEFKSNGYITNRPNLLTLLTAKRTVKNFTIHIDREEISKSETEGQLDYTLTHELMHAFGFADVYTVERNKTTDKFYGNTYINSRLSDVGLLTPNDVKCLIALYSNDETNQEQVNKLLEEHSEAYYDNFTNICAEKCGKLRDFNATDIAFEGGIRITNEAGEKYGYRYQVNIENGKYEFTILDYYTYEILDGCSGNVVYKNGIAVLENIELQKGMRPYDEMDSYYGGFVQDFAIGYLDGQDNRIVLYDLNTNWTVHFNELNLQKNIEQ